MDNHEEISNDNGEEIRENNDKEIENDDSAEIKKDNDKKIEPDKKKGKRESEAIETSADNDIVNVANYLRKMAQVQPYKRAVVYPFDADESGRVAYTHLTFLQLEQESDCIARGLEKVGITRGTRTILMVNFSLEFFVLIFALFKVGAVPVVVDPGMGKRRMLSCLHESRAEAFIGIPLANFIRRVAWRFFENVQVDITLGKRWLWRGYRFEDIRQTPWESYPIAKTKKNETAAILFTSGSTGPAKGVIYTHGMFDAQVSYIRTHFNITSDDIDLPTFPLFALFDPALGMTAVIPEMDPRMPAKANPEYIIEAIMNHGVTNMFASPALLNRVGNYGKEEKIKLPSLKRVISAGAPVSPSNIETFSSMLNEDTEIFTPYGATEAMPVLAIGSHEILSETRKFTEQGYGMCVGRPIEGIEVEIIQISDDPIEEWSDDLIVPDGDIGEITVIGDVVSKRYFDRPKSDALAKIREGNRIWHRMGDLGWKDNKGRVWFCGRKSHRVITENGTLFTIPCEAIFNTHPAVFRSALVGVGKPPDQKPIVCIELNAGGKNVNKDELKRELLNLAARNVATQDIKTILFYNGSFSKKGFPVDPRHNSKINREKLAIWAK